MLLKEYGHFRIVNGGEVITAIPSFANIANIGTAKEIVKAIKAIGKIDHVSVKWAYDVVQSCCDKPLPDAFKPSFVMGENGHLQCDMDILSLRHLITLASHCILHGVIGKVDHIGKGEPMTEFDAYEYTDLAATHFKMSYAEAASMTMTQFVRRMRTEYPEAHKSLSDGQRNIDGKTYGSFSAAAEAAKKKAELKNG